MQNDRIVFLASAIVFGTGAIWGLYWLPVRGLAGLGLPGAWGTAAITAAAVLLLLPVALADRRGLAATPPLALAAIAVGGAAFGVYSVALLYGRVAIVILLYFLTPVWSTLIGRYVMGWPTPRLRLVAIAVGLAGLLVMLGATGEAPLPKTSGEWMGLVAGILWSIGTTGIRAKSALRPGPSAFVFAVGALISALLLAPFLGPVPAEAPDRLLSTTGLALAAGGLWWGVFIVGLMWATVRLEPARVGLLLMTEVLVGAASAAVLAGENLHPLEMAGGALVLCAGLLEIWPVRRTADGTPK